jgi:hypothetical protein
VSLWEHASNRDKERAILVQSELIEAITADSEVAGGEFQRVVAMAAARYATDVQRAANEYHGKMGHLNGVRSRVESLIAVVLSGGHALVKKSGKERADAVKSAQVDLDRIVTDSREVRERARREAQEETDKRAAAAKERAEKAMREIHEAPPFDVVNEAAVEHSDGGDMAGEETEVMQP